MLAAESGLSHARDLAGTGRYAEVLTYLDGLPKWQVEGSPYMSLLLGTAHARLGRTNEGVRWVDLAIESCRARGERPLETRALNARGAIALSGGDLDLGADYFTQAMLSASRDGDHDTIGRCSNNLGIVNNIKGRHAEAAGSYAMAVAAFERAGSSQGIAEARHNLGITHAQQGELDLAFAEAKRAHEAALEAGEETLAAMTLRGRAEIRVLRGEYEMAEREIERSLETHRRLGDAVEEAEDLRIAASILAAQGKHEDAEQMLRDVIARAEATDRPQLLSEATRDLAYVLRSMGREDEALEAAKAAITGFEQLGAEAEIRKLDSQEWGYPLAKELRKALRPLHEAQRLADTGRYAELVSYLDARPIGDLEQSPTLALLYGIGIGRMGRLEEGRQWVTIALARARVLDDRVVEVRALNVYGVISLELGGMDEARGFFMRAQAEAMRDGDLATVGRCANNLGVVANMEGDFGRAVGAYTTAIAAYQRVGLERGVAETHHNLGVTHRDRGDLDQAMQAADQAVADAGELGDTALMAQAIAGRAEIRTASDPKFAIREAERAIDLHRELGDKVRESEDLRILAAALASDGQSDKAEATLRDVVERAREHARPLLIATAQRDLAHLLAGLRRSTEAVELAEDARETFAELGAKTQVEKLDEFLASQSA